MLQYVAFLGFPPSIENSSGWEFPFMALPGRQRKLRVFYGPKILVKNSGPKIQGRDVGKIFLLILTIPFDSNTIIIFNLINHTNSRTSQVFKTHLRANYKSLTKKGFGPLMGARIPFTSYYHIRWRNGQEKSKQFDLPSILHSPPGRGQGEMWQVSSVPWLIF